ncbi:MAG: C25 family cysteine peptidase [Candidatus Zixiibacteriota bacterium]
MKKLSGNALIVLLICLGMAISAVAENSVKLSDAETSIRMLNQDQMGVTFQLEIGEIDFLPVATKEGSFVYPQISGLSRSFETGKPNLPVAGKLISIPIGAELMVEVIDFEMEEINLSDFNITDPIMPAQPSISKSDDPESIPFEMDQNVYASSNYYAEPPVRTEILGILRDMRLANVYLSPMEYNPVENKIRVYKNITVRVSFANADWSATKDLRSKHYSPVFAPVYDQIINYDALVPANKADSTDRTKYPIKYLIISDRMFETQLQPFIEWKTLKGFNVVVGYTDVIGSSTSAIESYIQTLYNAGTTEDPAPSFVLLVGDVGQIPTYSGTAGSHVTDIYYCEFTGDLLPEIYYGRFSAQNAAQLQPQIDKTIEYEKYLMPDPSYLDEVTLVAGVDGTYAITHGNGQLNYGTEYYFNAAHNITDNTWLYPASDASGAAAAIIDTINDGVSFHNYTAHCSHTGQADPSFTTSDVPGLTNYNKYFLGIGNCCLANTFSESTPCFGEALMQIAGKGAIGYIGASNSTYWDEDYFWGVGYGPVVSAGPTYEQTTLGAYDGLFHDMPNEASTSRHYVTNDAIIFAGNLGVSASTSSRKAYYWEAYHLMGDPSIVTYLGVPLANTISHDATVMLTAETFAVSADAGSYVAISVGGVLQGAAFVDATGSVDVSMEGFASPGTAEIVITCQNREPYISTIQVIAPDGPFVIRDEYTINDASGNNDGLINCGESISLDMQLMNVGPDMAYNVTAQLSTTDTFVTITDNYEAYDPIEGDFGIQNIIGAFAFDVAGSTPNGHLIQFTLAINGSDTRDTTWTSNFNVRVYSPELAYLSIILDDPTGNGNGKLDPGETGDLIVVLQNNGEMDALTISATLSETDDMVSISDDQGYFGDIMISGTGNNGSDVYTVSADAACPMGYLMTMHLDITGASGYFTSVDFNFVVGDRVAFFFDDFSFDQGWTGMGGNGEWTIGPAVGGTGSDGSGGPDPSVDHSPSSDNYVLGNDLNSGSGGDYNSGLSSTYWVSSPIFDLSGFSGVQMTYWHWLGVESPSYDHAYFQVYDGSAWVTLFENGGTINESAWNEEFYDLSEYADGNQDFQIRFGIGSTDGSDQYCGWNIDDVELKGYGTVQTGAPELSYDPTEIDDSLHLGDEAIDTVTVTNGGETLLRIRFTTNDGWLNFNTEQQNIGAGETFFLPVTVQTSGLMPGDHFGSINYSCNDPLNNSGSIAVSLHIYSPEIALEETEISETLPLDGQMVHPFVINNDGPGRLEYSISRLMFNGKYSQVELPKIAVPQPIGFRTINDDKAKEEELEEPYFAPSTKAHGGPDAWGYNWVDSDDPDGPIYGWIDISTLGTAVTLGDDDTTTALPIGFSFPFYDNYYSELYIGSNGIVTFGTPSRSRSNIAIPNDTLPNNLVSMWWDDLDPRKGGNIFYYSDIANERFIVSFDYIRNYYSTTGTGSLCFQAIFYTNGKILFQYAAMDPGDDYDGLAGATIGIENAAGTDGLEVVYNAEYIHDQLAILFTAASWLSINPGTGSIDPYTADTIDVGFDATDLPGGVYNGQLSITNNDPDEGSIDVAVTMTIEEEPQAPESPTLVSPGNNAADLAQPLMLDWNDVPTAAMYQVQVDGNDLFEACTVDSNMTATSCAVSGLDEGAMHYWRVRAQNVVGWGAWSEIRNFTTEITWVCGDYDGNQTVNILDITGIISYLYKDGTPPAAMEAVDVNGDSLVNIIDITTIITFLYKDGSALSCGR